MIQMEIIMIQIMIDLEYLKINLLDLIIFKPFKKLWMLYKIKVKKISMNNKNKLMRLHNIWMRIKLSTFTI